MPDTKNMLEGTKKQIRQNRKKNLWTLKHQQKLSKMKYRQRKLQDFFFKGDAIPNITQGNRK